MTCHRGSWRYLAVLSCALIGAASGQQTYEPIGGQTGTSYPGACPLQKLGNVIVTVIATLPESTTGPLSIAFTPATNYPYGNPVVGFSTSPSWNQFLNNTAAFFSAAVPTVPGATPVAYSSAATGLKFFGECQQNVLTMQATCSFVFDYSTRRLLDLLSKASPAGGIPLGGTLTFNFCSIGVGNSEVSSPTCFESRGGTPKPVIVRISSKEPADVIPQLGFNGCYNDAAGSPAKCLAFAIIQSCAQSSQVGYGTSGGAVGGAGAYTGGGALVASSGAYAALAPAIQGLPEGESTVQVAAAPGTEATAAPGPLAAKDLAKHHHKHKKAGKKQHKQALAAGTITEPHGAVQQPQAMPATVAGTFTPATAGRKLMD